MKNRIDYFNNLYRDMIVNMPETISMQIPEHYGTGEISQTTTKQGIIISEWKLKYYSDMRVQGTNTSDYLQLIFCIEEGMSWTIEETQENFDINKGEVVIYNGNGKNEVAFYKGNSDYHFKSIKIPVTYFTNILNTYFELNEVQIYSSKLFDDVLKIVMTNNMMRVLSEIKDFLLYRGGLGHLFLEAKILELLSMCLSEVLEIRILPTNNNRLSRTDRETVLKAKDFIDSQIDYAPSYKEIAEHVHVSVSKLSKDFMNFVGQPIHSYIIEQRLEKATALLLENNLSISQIAVLVGYSKSSNFTEAFRKKFGVTPKAYRENLK